MMSFSVFVRCICQAIAVILSQEFRRIIGGGLEGESRTHGVFSLYCTVDSHFQAYVNTSSSMLRLDVRTTFTFVLILMIFAIAARTALIFSRLSFYRNLPKGLVDGNCARWLQSLDLQFEFHINWEIVPGSQSLPKTRCSGHHMQSTW